MFDGFYRAPEFGGKFFGGAAFAVFPPQQLRVLNGHLGESLPSEISPLIDGTMPIVIRIMSGPPMRVFF